jgi:hypothetical protein
MYYEAKNLEINKAINEEKMLLYEVRFENGLKITGMYESGFVASCLGTILFSVMSRMNERTGENRNGKGVNV